MSDGTASALGGTQPHTAVFPKDELVVMGEWVAKPFDIEHDAPEPKGFIIFHTQTKDKIVYLTDTGFTRYVPVKPNILIVECSYCDDILDRNQIELGPRYLRLKKHHFSLKRVLDFLMALDRSNLRRIVLVHLSHTNSDANRMVTEIQQATGITPVVAKAGLTIELD